MSQRTTTTLLFLIAMTSPLASSPLLAQGGKWTPPQLAELDPAWLAELGLALPVSELWRPEGGGLLEAAVQISGCSAGFVSADGLLLTNHHCIFSILQQHSTPERDLIRDGFLATRREEELPGATVRVTIPHRRTDVTAEVEAAAAGAHDDHARHLAIERKRKELVAACEAQPFRRCQVAIYDDGVRYELIEALELPDVRLVWAPPRAIGEYGGEVDNWSWPRHTGDFALARVWAEDGANPAPFAATNVPYRPKRFFALQPRGVAEGDFVMVIGYPGTTFRSLIASEVAEKAERAFPGRSRLYRAWLDLMDEASAADPGAAIALADRAKTLANREKNARGQVAGIARGDLLAARRRADEAVLTWIAAHPEHTAAAAAYRELETLFARQLETWDRDFLLGQLRAGSKPLGLALQLARWAVEREKPDLEREPEYQERNRDRLLDEIRRDQKRLHEPTEKKLLADQLGRLAALPTSQRSAAVDALLGPAPTPETIAARVEALFAGSRVGVLAEREAMFGETAAQLAAREDSLLDLGLALTREILEIEKSEKTWKGAVSRLRPQWRRAVAASLGRPLDPDANSTQRVSFAKVAGYSPRDAVWMRPATTFAGLLEKHTGEEPFDVPDAVLAAAPRAATSRFRSAALGDLPVCFLATADTTGGNSGSPVVNGRGEMVGINFDRVWENVANDFGYNPEVARNVSADVRYLLWMLEEVAGSRAAGLLSELGIAPASPAAVPSPRD
ncbi:MAG TPA: S46 family peptidase [Thermoanaerobaculia bacterium]|nr:S46 family peptidase [Thermoanaerobaculia bacterium]